MVKGGKSCGKEACLSPQVVHGVWVFFFFADFRRYESKKNFMTFSSLKAKLRKRTMFGNTIQLQTEKWFISLKGSQKLGSKEGHAVITSQSFFNENSISLNVANSSSFGCMIDESVEFAKQNPVQSFKTSFRIRRCFSCEVTQRLCVTF